MYRVFVKRKIYVLSKRVANQIGQDSSRVIISLILIDYEHKKLCIHSSYKR
jgi:hypothetical protein